MAAFVYILCTLTSSLCAGLLLSNYRRTGLRLLFWSGACFVCLAVGNVLLFIDRIILPTTVDLTIWRNSAALTGLALLIYGLIWDAERMK
ncbi:MAG TPA: DUF5985 family protein [Candidatus Limnocylindria bacterium]|nr:DUF5985 family protein [Candidatus Limnocylindria bacterium]